MPDLTPAPVDRGYAYLSGVFMRLVFPLLRDDERSTLIVLLTYLPDPRPSLARLADQLGKHEASVRRSLASLQAVGIVRRETRGGDPRNPDSTNRYLLPDLRDGGVCASIRAQLMQQGRTAGTSCTSDTPRYRGKSHPTPDTSATPRTDATPSTSVIPRGHGTGGADARGGTDAAPVAVRGVALALEDPLHRRADTPSAGATQRDSREEIQEKRGENATPLALTQGVEANEDESTSKEHARVAEAERRAAVIISTTPGVVGHGVSSATRSAVAEILLTGGEAAAKWCITRAVDARKTDLPARYIRALFEGEKANAPWRAGSRGGGRATSAPSKRASEFFIGVDGEDAPRKPYPRTATVFERVAGPLETVARHEAGHVAAAMALGVRVRSAQACVSGGLTIVGPRPAGIELATIALAGEAAEAVFRGGRPDNHPPIPRSDADREPLMRGLAGAGVDRHQAHRTAWEAALQLVQVHSDVVALVAAELVKRGRISGGRALAIWRGTGRTFVDGKVAAHTEPASAGRSNDEQD